MYGLDWLRVVATLLVVALHAGIPYMSHPLPGLVWSVPYGQQSDIVDLTCWWINGFIMPLFFLMSGFLGAGLLVRHGPGGFLRHRLKRLGGPLLFGFVFILPLDLYAWLLGWLHAGWITPETLKTLKVAPPLDDALWGFSHLWFLQYLLLFCVTAWALHSTAARLPGERTGDPQGGGAADPFRPAGIQNGPATPASSTFSTFIPAVRSLIPLSALLAGIAVCAAVLWFQPRIVIGFRHTWLPQWENVLYYAVPFTLGWYWQRGERALPHWQCAAGLLLASGCFLLMWPGIRSHVLSERIPVADPAVPLLFAAFGLLMATGLFGLAVSVKRGRAPRTILYLSNACFWVYLLHHPLVGLTHVDLALVGWPPLLKFLLTTSVVLLLCLLTYEVGVRRTAVGLLLNGFREERPVLEEQTPPVPRPHHPQLRPRPSRVKKGEAAG